MNTKGIILIGAGITLEYLNALAKTKNLEIKNIIVLDTKDPDYEKKSKELGVHLKYEYPAPKLPDLQKPILREAKPSNDDPHPHIPKHLKRRWKRG